MGTVIIRIQRSELVKLRWSSRAVPGSESLQSGRLAKKGPWQESLSFSYRGIKKLLRLHIGY
ncbi:hypothetical protein F9K88_16775 [Brucella intermedia]|uniref:Uncharacterized protein n=2 Tax=Brucella intermedia TaxID=94625 RepID=C4WQD8_9HYPH|nr:hypothetical protein [Brucella intermedia]EEQ94479.1 Hypothetical protein OINT_2001709 [Brucella intermedia LMG 3301]PJT25072.1 hypothetical protein CN884_09290 [Ochrobactrum sp. 30A/1000/2015]PJT40522.1 hypothetical protein CN883_03275 [Ochrobactrum sp. 27A/999/2015]PJT42841.1 hypothetical protein CN882_12775 [Ochrobactrum sp. 23A/997/2015]ELT49151.1 hypothetical protein D584_10242 [Brucella intermedia M86]